MAALERMLLAERGRPSSSRRPRRRRGHAPADPAWCRGLPAAADRSRGRGGGHPIREGRRRTEPERPHHECRVLSFVHRSGGMGATSLAIETAFELCNTRRGQAKRRVCLVDLDFQGGAAWLHLDAEPLLDIVEIVRSPHRLDGELLAAMTTHHPGRV